MAVKIRLKRMGKIRNAQYRIVVMDSRSKRDGRAIEEIGIYQPRQEPSLIRVDRPSSRDRFNAPMMSRIGGRTVDSQAMAASGRI